MTFQERLIKVLCRGIPFLRVRGFHLLAKPYIVWEESNRRGKAKNDPHPFDRKRWGQVRM